MSTEIDVKPKSLYDIDYQLWLDETVAQLQSQNFSALDLENLIEEIESLGRSDQRSLKSYLRQLCEHFLKLRYWEADRERCFRGWNLEIANLRLEIQSILEDSPSLRNVLKERFGLEHGKARKTFLKASSLKPDLIPEEPDFTLEQVLDEDWLPWQPDPSDNN
ncbi:DUF29 domain-containing protein [Phormidium tenue]|uniref:DUF29 domain-containing protein n=1 Tax=Phormidium tenue NIES-30 TaxID=549789 RepID=A0A1U7J1M2_9CYAN|nr:DUF29 domain-containing protein [Phormidium tenue]MBD2233876.1 DUF29 domain-containing protein [Phormidium tenue FACHB-1052]OKH45729.1 hypothetical protein NIES30_19285 [Phormidium tenue NIES-30]